MQEVKLQVKETINGEAVLKTVSYEVDEMTFMQFTRLMDVIKEAFKELQGDEGMNSFMESLFGGGFKIDENTTPQEVIQQADQDFIVKLMGGFEFLAGKLPDRALQLVSVLSDIPVEVLNKQKFVKVFDVYDAVIEVNDIEAIVNRAKKSLAGTVAKVKFMQLVKKATQK